MPTTITILSKAVKQRAFNAPPKFITTERQAYFELTPDAQKYLRTLRTVYQQKQGKTTQYAPTKFLVKKEKDAIFQNDKFNVPLYKMFLYRHIVSQIKSGELSLQYSYEYRSLDGYMISPDEWSRNKTRLIKDAGLTKYTNAKQRHFICATI